MTRIRFNGEEQAVEATTLAELLAGFGLDASVRGVAAARNGVVVCAADWAGTPVAAGDEIDVIRAFYGG